MLRLKIDQLAKQPVVVGVADLRRVTDVVEVRMVVDLRAQCVDTLADVRGSRLAHRSGESAVPASATAKIFSPASSNLMVTSSPERVMMRLRMVPSPYLRWRTRMPCRYCCGPTSTGLGRTACAWMARCTAPGLRGSPCVAPPDR